MTTTCIKRILIAAAAIAAAALFVLFLWMRGAFLPRWITWCSHTDAVEESEAVLKNRRFRITKDGETLFETPAVWCVQDSCFADINNDGRQEVILLVWKRGSYGKHRPTWVKRDETGFSQHLFIYEFRPVDGKKEIHAIWMSSKLDFFIQSMEAGPEIPGTGRPSIAVTDTDGRDTRWGWLSWGLTRVG